MSMLYKQLAEVSSFITDSSHRLDDILQMLCLKAMASLQADALLYAEIDHTGVAVQQASFGVDLVDKSGNKSTFAISETTPFTDAIRENNIIWINSLPQWPKQYAKMKNVEIPSRFKTIIAWPIDAGGLPVGSLSAFSHAKLDYQESTAQYLEAISIILANALINQKAIHRSQSRPIAPNRLSTALSEPSSLDQSEYNQPLTERQSLILKLISEGRTNAAIADVLGYSESLIRQETIKIYAKLGCSGRNEAAQIFIGMQSRASEIAV
jgi:DNA-binding CsgD family transcriptional regulator